MRLLACSPVLASELEESSKVPNNIKEIHKEFWVCQKCGQAYWQGSQYGNAMQKLSDSLTGLMLSIPQDSAGPIKCMFCQPD